MQTTDEAWEEYKDFALEPTTPRDLLDMLHMAYCSGRLGGLAAVGEAMQDGCPRDAWRTLTQDAVEACDRQADKVNALIAAMIERN